jgi:hypothetical protein
MTGMSPADPIAPDTKDWTWVLARRCDECGFDAVAHEVADLPGLLHDTATTWSQLAKVGVLARPDAARRPAPTVWSPLEYGAHVRDVHELFARRLRLMLEEDTPTFANWDQDATAVEGDYAGQDAAAVAVELVEAAVTVAEIYATVTDETRTRRGVRSNGDEFTVESLGRYHLHDVVHHLHDVGAG